MDEQGKTAPIELPVQSPTGDAEAESLAPPIVIQPDAPHREPDSLDGAPTLVAREATPSQQEVMFVPLAVSLGDGFKFGCGFFLALAVAGLAGCVLLGVIFVLTNLLGVSPPVSP